MGVTNIADEAETAFAAEDYDRSLALALDGLASEPDDPGLLRIAGLSGLELGDDDAAVHLARRASLTPGEPAAWLDLGFAHAAMGDHTSAADAFAKVVELDADDATALVHLAHALHGSGRPTEAVDALERADELDPANPVVLRSLLEFARAGGNLTVAFDTAQQLGTIEPKDVVVLATLGELQMELGYFSNAAASFARLRRLDTDDGHESFACHGQIEALLRAERWRAALDVAIEATLVDRHQLTTELLAFTAAKLFGEGDHPAPEWSDLDAALAEERAMHRRMHLEQGQS